MPNEPRWISIDEIIETNQAVVEATDEPHFVRDRELLEAVCAKPRNHWAYGETDIVVLSVEVLFGIALGHAFEQGNKRTAFISAVDFLNYNGFDLASDNFGDLIIRVIEKRLPEAHFTEMWRAITTPI